MDNNSQTDSFMFDLDNLIRRYQQEFDINDQTIVGALEFAKLTVLTDADILFSPDDVLDPDDDDINPHFWLLFDGFCKIGWKNLSELRYIRDHIKPPRTLAFFLLVGVVLQKSFRKSLIINILRTRSIMSNLHE